MEPTKSDTRATGWSKVRHAGALGATVGLAVAILATAWFYVGFQALGYRFYEVQSDSMKPRFERGDVVAVKPKPAHEVKAGEVVAFRSREGEAVIIHRVVGIQSLPDVHSIYKDKEGNIVDEKWTYSPRTFYTKGDANLDEDSVPVGQQRVVGTQKFVVPGSLALVVQHVNRRALFFVGASCILAFIAWEAVDIARQARHRKQRTARPQSA